MLVKYLPHQFEEKWVKQWEEEKVYQTGKPDKNHPKVYTLSMFPYPSGAGLHVGHVRIYTGTDVFARYWRMKGYRVLHPTGWDAFGLPAENAAIKAKKNPLDMVPQNIANFKRQMMRLGFSYDWEKEFSTADSAYYQWTQWLFIQFFKMGLLYKKNAPIHFCPKCKTGLAEEEVLPDGTHERCGTAITKKELPQWLFRITAYADRLLSDLKGLDWPEGILEMQRNWIGKEKGLSIKFLISSNQTITVWTKFWETVFGVTFLVVSPEYEWLQKLIKANQVSKEVKDYVNRSLSKTDEQRLKQEKDKTGVFTGYYALNPVDNKKIPIWVADYVLAMVGTGAVMGVPAHDERDFKFAKKYHLPIIQVVSYSDKSIDQKVAQGLISHEEEGNLVNSGQFNGLSAWAEGKKKMAAWMIKKGFAHWQINYHLRDWIFSRQRYWGEPIPMVYCEKCGWQPVPEDELPVKLPYVKSYEPTATGESPLAKIDSFVKTSCPNCGGEARRETDTMPNWAGSCWYYLRFPSEGIKNLKFKIKNSNLPWQKEDLVKWLPVDWYLGGAEHAVLHLLYSRFWVKALYDLKLLPFSEPFLRLRNVGMVLAEDHRKMSKSLGNVVNPDEVTDEFGADALRIYEMFMAPFSSEIAWSTKAMQGGYRFLTRVWQIYHQSDKISDRKENEDKSLVIKLQRLIDKISSDITNVKFNTAIAAMMEFLNHWEGKTRRLSKENAKKFLQVLAPFAPFITEEIWREVFKEQSSIHLSQWPAIKGSVLKEAVVVIPIQVNGKKRTILKIPRKIADDKGTVVKKALENEKVKKYLKGKSYNAIYVKEKILNFVV